jgi:hypothetical protein
MLMMRPFAWEAVARELERNKTWHELLRIYVLSGSKSGEGTARLAEYF